LSVIVQKNKNVPKTYTENNTLMKCWKASTLILEHMLRKFARYVIVWNVFYDR